MEMAVTKKIVFCLSLIATCVLGQTEKFYMNKSNSSLQEILRDIEINTGKSFVYSDDAIDSEKKVTLIGYYTLTEALSTMFRNTNITFTYSGDKVVVLHREAKKKRHTLSGYIREKDSGEPLPLANVYLPWLKYGSSANNYGFYLITVPEDTLTVVISYAGFQPQVHRLTVRADIELDGELDHRVLNEVIITADRETQSDKTEISHINIPVEQMNLVPFLFGERDVFKLLQLMPGVKRGAEGSGAFYVRGGGADQNLILLDDAPVYNANHLFGFFSAFNGNAIKSIDFFKGGFPARYGGRLSSVLDTRMNEGSQNKTSGNRSIGLLSSSLAVNGPIKKGKVSFMVAGRRTYADLLAKPFLKPGDAYYFYDFNSKVGFNIDRHNKIYASGYFSKDDLKAINSDEDSYFLRWGNQTASLRWNHQFSNRFFSNTSLIYSNFNLNSGFSQVYQDTTYFSSYQSGIRHLNFKFDADIFPSSKHHIRTGLNFIAHQFNPGALVVKERSGLDFTNFDNTVHAIETALYAEDEFVLSPELSFDVGARLTGFDQTLGQMKLNPEPRAIVRYQFSENWSAKAAYSKMYQYIHLLSNTSLGLPTDFWVPSTDRVPREQSSQWVAGVVRDLPRHHLSISIEAYSKTSNNIINYKPGSTFLAINRPTSEQYLSWEEKVVSGQGWSKGIELFLQKRTGRLNGWIGYTLSKTELQFDAINFGEKFFANYDRRHDLSVVAIWELNKKIKLSGTWIYQSGNRITAPQNQFLVINHDLFRQQAGSYNEVVDYSSKNSFQTPDYHRLDLSIQFHKQKKRVERIWEIGLYNAYYRKNPFFYHVVNDNHSTYLQGENIFPIIPSFSYQIHF